MKDTDVFYADAGQRTKPQGAVAHGVCIATKAKAKAAPLMHLDSAAGKLGGSVTGTLLKGLDHIYGYIYIYI